MALDVRLLEELQRRKGGSTDDVLRGGAGGGDEPPGGGGYSEARFRALEASVASIDKTLAVMAEQLKHVSTREDVAVISGKLDTKAERVDVAAIAGKLDLKAAATELAELKGRVARIPTVPVLVSILVLISLLFAAGSWIVRHLPESWSRALQ